MSTDDDIIYTLVGIGTIYLKTSKTKLVLNNVKHDRDVRLHLISVGVFGKGGFVSTNGNGEWKLIKGSFIVSCGNKLCGLY